MSYIDKQRITAVRTREAMRYVFPDEWIGLVGGTMAATAEADVRSIFRCCWLNY
jgi:hypothetical protein